MTYLKYWVKFGADKSYSSFYMSKNYSGTYSYDKNDKTQATVSGKKVNFRIISQINNEAECTMNQIRMTKQRLS